MAPVPKCRRSTTRDSFEILHSLGPSATLSISSTTSLLSLQEFLSSFLSAPLLFYPTEFAGHSSSFFNLSFSVCSFFFPFLLFTNIFLFFSFPFLLHLFLFSTLLLLFLLNLFFFFFILLFLTQSPSNPKLTHPRFAHALTL